MTAILPGFARCGEWYGAAMTRYRRLRLILWVLSVSPLAIANSVDAATKKSNDTAPSSPAATTQRLGTTEGWTAYAYAEKSGQVCYLAGEPQKSEPKNAKRKTPRAMVTHRPDEKVANVVSFAAGLPLKEGSDASLDIGGTKFDLFTKGDSAWARTGDLDKAIVEAMAKGKQAVVKSIPQKGQPVTDTYLLAGFTQTLAMIDKACSIKR
jgi:invasion protein IalB